MHAAPHLVYRKARIETRPSGAASDTRLPAWSESVTAGGRGPGGSAAPAKPEAPVCTAGADAPGEDCEEQPAARNARLRATGRARAVARAARRCRRKALYFLKSINPDRRLGI